jgi:uncharacterized protein (TIGR00297 family)
VASAWHRLLWAAICSGGIGIVARRRGALTTSGAVGALITGTSIVAAGGWDWGAALVYFFISSSALSHVATARKASIAADKFDKGSQRDLAQALANGGVATMAALLRSTPLGIRQLAVAENAFAGALAAATADTWATEIGTLNPQPPRLITSGRSVPPGTSGGVTPLGLASAAVGAITLGGTFVLARSLVPQASGTAPPRAGALVRAALAGGLAGCLTDSLLGATLQAMYRCPRCASATERRRHVCGTPTQRERGLPWLDNDGVNALSTLVGAVAGAAAGRPWRAARPARDYARN